MPLGLAATIAILTILDLVLVGLVLIPHVRTFDDLKKRQNGLRLMLASVLGPVLSGVLGAGQEAVFLKTSFISMIAMSALADCLGIAIFIPLILLLAPREALPSHKFEVKPLPLVLSSAFFVLVCCGTFWQTWGPYLFLIFPALIWLLLVAGLEGAIFGSVFITIVGWIATSHDRGPISLLRIASPNLHLITFQIFVVVCVVTALPIGAAIDERNRAERISSNSFSIQRAILKYTREAIVLSSLDGSERYASPGIERLTGWTPSEYVAIDRLQTVHPGDRERVRDLLESFSHETPETALRYRNLHKNGSWTWVEASISIYGENKIDGYVGTIRDITRLVEAEQGWIQERRTHSEEQQRLVEAEQAAKIQVKLRDEFLSHVSHELRSPLTSIYSFTSILADGLAGEVNPQQNEYLGIVLKNVEQLQAMIEDLLTVTKTSEGKLSIELQAASLNEAVVDAHKTLAGFAKRKHILVSQELFPEVADVYADPVRLRQVLIILLDNAIKFTPEHGSVRISISQRGDHLLTQVIDSGVGISSDKLELIFDKLYQIDGPANSDTSAAGRTGLGLGLHIARSLVVRQSGRIWVTSMPGEGSNFQFTLPIYTRRESGRESDSRSQA